MPEKAGPVNRCAQGLPRDLPTARSRIPYRPRPLEKVIANVDHYWQ